MPSFDIVSKVDLQALDKAVNVVKKEIQNRFDFKDSPVDISLDKKEFTLKVETGDDMKMRQLMDVLINRAHTSHDIVLPIDAHEKRLFGSIDGERRIGEIVGSGDRDLGRALFEKLWWHDQIVFDASR